MKKLNDKIGKKQFMIGASLLSLVLIVAVAFFLINGLSEKELTLELKEEKIVLEYGKDTVSDSPLTYIKIPKDKKDFDQELVGNSKVLISPAEYVCTTKECEKEVKEEYKGVASYKVKIVYNDGKKDYKVIADVEIKDTIAPKFIDVKDKIEVTREYSGDLATNFKAEDLSEVSVTIDAKNVDFAKAGEYKAKAIATDKYKNKATKEFTIVVGEKTQAELDTEKQQAEQQAQQEQQAMEQQNQQNNSTGGGNQSGGNTGTGNSGNTGGSGSGGNSGGGGSGVCSFTGWQQVGNSGYANHDWATADAWADANWPDWSTRYYVVSTKDNCGNAGWTVEWK